jgi:hypothetical protein
MEKHDIDIAPRVEFTTPVAAERDEADRNDLRPVLLLRRTGDGRKNMAQNNVDQRRAARADFAAPAARLMPQSQAMIFDLEKLLVERQQMRRRGIDGGPQLALRVFENFVLMLSHSLGKVNRCRASAPLVRTREPGQAERPPYNWIS